MLQEKANRERRLREKLALQRPMTSLIEKEILATSDAIVTDASNWVTMWVDTGHAVTVDRGVTAAYRGICTDGRLLWLVRHIDRQHGYHSTEADPLAAIEQAEQAWVMRKIVRQRWAEVEEVARELRAGRMRFDVTLEDAKASPLCTVGIEGFLNRMRLNRVSRVSGRVAGLLMHVEPQVGFVIDVAYRRSVLGAEPTLV